MQDPLELLQAILQSATNGDGEVTKEALFEAFFQTLESFKQKEKE